jgi:hypothetical protein
VYKMGMPTSAINSTTGALSIQVTIPHACEYFNSSTEDLISKGRASIPMTFGAIITVMRKIASHAELTEIIRLGDGYVFNDRNDRKMLHRANCEALEVMSTRMYDKLFFGDFREAKSWLDARYGAKGWEGCGKCG